MLGHKRGGELFAFQSAPMDGGPILLPYTAFPACSEKQSLPHGASRESGKQCAGEALAQQMGSVAQSN